MKKKVVKWNGRLSRMKKMMSSASQVIFERSYSVPGLQTTHKGVVFGSMPNGIRFPILAIIFLPYEVWRCGGGGGLKCDEGGVSYDAQILGDKIVVSVVGLHLRQGGGRSITDIVALETVAIVITNVRGDGAEVGATRPKPSLNLHIP
ncbi:hypothetical protein V8G54_037056 [Vigna mungo]|uniref:Uncharacterized protein n=1 Tax=Vigna mungo TaxID=3915 RepID=A0AAQ3RG56_VIGMU